MQGYGKTSVIGNAHVSNIVSLPNGFNPNKINEFYETLLQSVQASETLGKIREVNCYTRHLINSRESGVISSDWMMIGKNGISQRSRKPLKGGHKETPPPPREQKDEEKPPKPTKSKAFQAKQVLTCPKSYAFTVIPVSIGQ